MLKREDLSSTGFEIALPEGAIPDAISELKLNDLKLSSFTNASTNLQEMDEYSPYLSFVGNSGYMQITKKKIELYSSQTRSHVPAANVTQGEKKPSNLRNLSQDLNYMLGLCFGKFKMALGDTKVEAGFVFQRKGLLPSNMNMRFNQAFLSKIGANATAIELSLKETEDKTDVNATYYFRKDEEDGDLVSVSYKFVPSGPLDLEQLLEKCIQGANRLLDEIGASE